MWDVGVEGYTAATEEETQERYGATTTKCTTTNDHDANTNDDADAMYMLTKK